MKPKEFRDGRIEVLLLNQTDLAKVMGYCNQPVVSHIENSASDVPAQTARLMQAYLDGYRPLDWPTRAIGKAFGNKQPNP